MRVTYFLSLLYFVCVLFLSNTVNADQYGTYEKPFSVDSPWNSYPVNPQFDEFSIPPAKYFPRVGAGEYSTACFKADSKAKPITIYPRPGTKGIYDADAENFIDHLEINGWPAELKPAGGSDGHVDLFDPENNKIHSFGGLKKTNGNWQARYYSWSKLSGRGWGDPAHYFQGVRAAAVPTCAGVIRIHEANDGKDIFDHVLALSLDFSALSSSPAFVFPATSADTSSNKNFGQIPEGALLMLPPDFDINRITTPQLKKTARTLQKYGAYVVDRNVDTPFHIYVEIGADWNLHRNAWNNIVGNELQFIRKSLRMVKSADEWRDGEDRQTKRNQSLNILSMRGNWRLIQGSRDVVYDTWSQSAKFASGTDSSKAENTSGHSITQVHWAKPKSGESYRLTTEATGGGQLQLILMDYNKRILFDSKMLKNDETIVFKWPSGVIHQKLVIQSGASENSSVSGKLIPEY